MSGGATARRHSDTPREIRLADLLGALSQALDLTEGQPEGHCVRCCYIGLQIGHALGLDAAAMRDLYYTVLLKDLGCSSNAARICELYLTDDLSFKHDFKELGGGLAQVLRFVLAHTGVKAGLTERLRAILHITRHGGTIATELIETRCHRGAEIARRMRFSEEVAAGIQALDEHWNGGGRPLGLAGEAIPMNARIALVAQVADVFQASSGPEAACAEIRARAGTWFDPRVSEAFARVAAAPDFWRTLRSPDLPRIVLALDPGQRTELVDEGYLDDITMAFAQVIDSKSPYTSGHSQRVAGFADAIAAELGLGASRRRWLRRAALLHDIGKLGVSNTILDKPGRLDREEFAAIQRHPSLGATILQRIAAFGDAARIAGTHHERLDGKGYPAGIGGGEIDLDTRIVTTADVFDALTADRPYRAAMPRAEALRIMSADLDTAFDPACFAALRRAIARETPALG